MSVFFEPTTVYGTREGYHSALMITSKDKGNCFLKSALYKSGVVSSVSMLPRFPGSVLAKMLSRKGSDPIALFQ